MRMNRRLVLVMVGFCALIFMYGVFLPHALAAEKVTLTGTVYEDEWDDNDNPTAVVIETDDGEEYKVSSEGKGKDLLKLGDKDVKVTGVVAEDSEGYKTITVTAYTVMD
jgi:hypothetical protein